MTINCKSQLIDLSAPKVMGILNITPDSFFDGGSYLSITDALKQVEKMLYQGATFIDIGGQSSKPMANQISVSDEIKRVVPVITAIQKSFPQAILSIDTFNSAVVTAAIEHGACMVNDIAAGTLDSQMFATVAKHKVPYIMMHMRGNPQTMQNLTQYNNIVTDVLYFFSQKIAQARAIGITDLLVDPGFGFAKTTEQNFDLINKLELFKTLDLPLLIGVSRKSMVYKTLQITPDEALNGTTVLHTIALSKGASILRVHDVAQAMQCITLCEKANILSC